MRQAQINVRTRACSRTSIARTKQAALTHNVRGKELKRSHFPMHDQSPGAVQGPDSIHSSQHIYGLITRQRVFNFLQCYMLCFYCCLDQRKETMMVHNLSQTEKGELNHYGTVFFSN